MINDKHMEVVAPSPVCAFCSSAMTLAWRGKTPTGGLLYAYICPNCFSTRFYGDINDPTFIMITEIQKAFTEIWKRKQH